MDDVTMAGWRHRAEFAEAECRKLRKEGEAQHEIDQRAINGLTDEVCRLTKVIEENRSRIEQLETTNAHLVASNGTKVRDHDVLKADFDRLQKANEELTRFSERAQLSITNQDKRIGELLKRLASLEPIAVHALFINCLNEYAITTNLPADVVQTLRTHAEHRLWEACRRVTCATSTG